MNVIANSTRDTNSHTLMLVSIIFLATHAKAGILQSGAKENQKQWKQRNSIADSVHFQSSTKNQCDARLLDTYQHDQGKSLKAAEHRLSETEKTEPSIA